MTGTSTPEPQREPWDVPKLEAALTEAAYQWLGGSLTHTLWCSDGTEEVYEVEDGAGDDPLILVRKSDGARFEIETWVTATELSADD